jgi:hypothetical protein
MKLVLWFLILLVVLTPVWAEEGGGDECIETVVRSLL